MCAFAGVCSVGSVICVEQTPFTSTLTTRKIIARYFRSRRCGILVESSFY
ncbi:hypothetical protein [uncultured Helicobacter sp.]|nr:hypothetical protein [uncultured Helicobacter sp.]